MGQDFVDKLVPELEAVSPVSGLLMTDILQLPDPIRQTVQWILRKQTVALSDLAGYLGVDEDNTRKIIDLMAQKGFIISIHQTGQPLFRIHTSPITHTTKRRKPPLNS